MTYFDAARETLHEIMTGGEIDHLIEYSSSRREKKLMMRFRENYKEMLNQVKGDYKSVSIVPILNEMKSADLFRDLLYLMSNRLFE